MSLSVILDTSKRAIMANKSAISTTSSNIANVNTEGYTRRRVTLDELRNKNMGFTTVGVQASAESLTRIRDRFVDAQLRSEYQNMGKYESDAKLFSQIEDVFGEPYESGLANVMSEFWNSWADLANDPESQYARTIVRDSGITLTKTFNRIYNDLSGLQGDISDELGDTVTEVNNILTQVKSLNEKIISNGTNDLLDARDNLVDELSSLINVDTKVADNGQITVFSNGNMLVSGDELNKLELEVEGTGDMITSTIKLASNDRELQIDKGKMGSLLEISNEYIPDYIDRLNTLANSVVDQVNTIHSNGYNLDGVTGIDFFSAHTTNAGNMAISDAINDHAEYIASSSELDEPGNNDIAQAIFDVHLSNTLDGGTVSEYYNTLISRVGSKTQEAEFLSESQEMVVSSLQNQQDSVSGVSLDEELIALTKYEQAYQAASKIVSTVDEMTTMVLNLL